MQHVFHAMLMRPAVASRHIASGGAFNEHQNIPQRAFVGPQFPRDRTVEPARKENEHGDRPRRSMDAQLAEEAEHGTPARTWHRGSIERHAMRGHPRDGVPREASVSYTVRSVPAWRDLARYSDRTSP